MLTFKIKDHVKQQFLEDRHLLESRQRQAEAKKLALQEQCRDDELIEKVRVKTLKSHYLDGKHEDDCTTKFGAKTGASQSN